MGFLLKPHALAVCKPEKVVLIFPSSGIVSKLTVPLLLYQTNYYD